MAKQERIVHVKVTSNVGKTNKEVTKTSASAKGLSASLKGVGASANIATGGIRAMATALLSSGVGAAVIAFGAIASVFRSAMVESMEFSKSLSGLRAITDSSKEEMEDFSKEAKRLGASTAFTASQVVELQTEFAKLGFSKDEILNVTEATLDLAAAAGTDLANAAMVAGSTLRGFGLDSSETARVADVMAESFSSSALDITTFQESMKLVAPIAKTVKVDIEQASAALSVLADSGIKGSMAGTQLRRVMTDLAMKTGKDFQTSLKMTQERLEGASSDAEKLSIAKELVGQRAASTLLILSENEDKLKTLEDAYDGAEGAAKRMAEVRLDNLTGDVTILESAWSGLLLSIEDGEGGLNGIARGAVQTLTSALNDLTEVINFTGFAMSYYFGSNSSDMESGLSTRAALIGYFGSQVKRVANQIMLVMSKIPILGRALDTEQIQKDLDKAVMAVKFAQMKIAQNFEMGEKDGAKKASFWTAWAETKKRLELKKTDALSSELQEGFIEGAVASEEKAEERKRELRDKFRNALTKKQEDFEDKTAVEKIEREKQRHLAELDTLGFTTEEKEVLKKSIEDFYRDKREASINSDIDKDNEKNRKAAEAVAEKFATINMTELQQLEIQEQQQLSQLTQEEKYDQTRTEIKNFYSKKRTDIENAEAHAKKRLALSTASDLFGSLASISKKNTKLASKFAIAQTLINTFQGMSEVEKKFASPELASDRALKIAAQASILAKGVAGIANIKKAASSVGASASGGSTGGVQTQAPSFNVVGQESADSLSIGSRLEALQGGGLKAFVVEEDVTNAQQNQSNVNDNASLG